MSKEDWTEFGHKLNLSYISVSVEGASVKL